MTPKKWEIGRNTHTTMCMGGNIITAFEWWAMENASWPWAAGRHQCCSEWPLQGLSGKEFACQCRRHGFNPWSGKIPHDMEQLHQCATTTKPTHHRWRVAPTCCIGKPHSVTKTQHRQKKNKIKRMPSLPPVWRWLRLPAPSKYPWSFPGGSSGKEPPCQCKGH